MARSARRPRVGGTGSAPGFSGGRRFAAAASFVSLCSLLLAAALAPGCKSDDEEVDPMSQGRIVIGGAATPVDDRAPSDAWVEAERALSSAEGAWRAGDPLTALAIANQALRNGVPADLEPKFREVRTRARAAVVTEKVVRLTAVPLKDAVADGDAVPVRILVKNLSAADLHAPRREKGSSDALFVLNVTREDRDVYGNVKSSEFTLRAPVEEDLAVPPGGEREVHVTIGADLVALRHEGFSVFRIGGTFRPVAVRVGETEFYDALPVEPALVRVFQKGWEPMAADPLASLRRAVSKRSPPHVLVATELLAATERDEARRVLLEATKKDRPLEFVLRAALARLDELDAPPATAGADAAGAAAGERRP